MDLRDLTEFLKDTMGYIITIAIVFLLLIYVVSFQQILGSSMKNTLNDGDILILDKISYRFNNPERKDIVAVNVNSTAMVKRIIGLPGETISYQNNVLYINGNAYHEDNITVETSNFGPITLGEDEYFVMGDNRTNSTDSRDYGPIKKDEIIGKSLFRIWPLSGIGSVK